jgi:hypothetical protein
MQRVLACLSLAGLMGCGAKTLLDVPHAPDGGGDGGVEVDAGQPDELIVDCGRSPVFTTPRRAVTLSGTATSPHGIAAQGWELVAAPPGAMPIVAATSDERVVVVTPDVPGLFRLRFAAFDGAGKSESCEAEVHAVVGAPVAICPDGELRTTLGTAIRVVGDGFDDEGVVAFSWEIVATPPGAMPVLIGADGPVAELRSSTPGRHLLRLTVTDTDGSTGSCEVAVLVTGPPEVRCDPTDVRTPSRRPVTLRAHVTDDVGIASRRWEVIERPERSSAVPAPPDADATTFTPDRRGRYRLRFTATDLEGLSATCEVSVEATPTPPDVTCPAMVETHPLTEVTVTASAVDDGTVVRWRWVLDGQPIGSAAAAPSPADRASTRFMPDVAGVYRLVVTATDDDGMSGTCTTRIRAANMDGLRVEMFWDTASSDIDLHLLNPAATRWAPSDDDCYFANCDVRTGDNLEWGSPGDEDNPRLDIDDRDGFGPENINIARPALGTYRIGVHAYRGSGTHGVTVRIYCGGSTEEPRATFGPVSLRAPGVNAPNDFWRVADVEVTSSGCTIRDLSRSDGPWIEVWNRARETR